MSTLPPRPARWRRAYPDALLAAERERLLARRNRKPVPPDATPPEQQRLPPDSTGLALSGGGIRSATFALGFFQGLARAKQLRRIDFLSTVSGGSYFGSVISSLLAREGGPAIEEVEELLPENPAADSSSASLGKEARPAPWLRRNGYYLAPNGGDVLLAGSIWLRNWLALHIVMFAALVTGGLLLQLPWLVSLGVFGAGWPTPLSSALQGATQPVLMISPWLDAVLVFLLLALSLGWAFWLLRTRLPRADPPTSRMSRLLREPHPAIGAVTALLLAILILALPDRWLPAWPWLSAAAWAVLLTAALSVFFALAVMRPASEISGTEPHVTATARNLLSRGMARALQWAAVVLLIAITDTLGQSAYASLHAQDSAWAGLSAFGGALYAGLSVLLLKAEKIQAWLSEKLSASTLQLSLQKLLPLFAAGLALLWLSAAATLSHAVLRDFGDPWLEHPPAEAVAASVAAPPDEPATPAGAGSPSLADAEADEAEAAAAELAPLPTAQVEAEAATACPVTPPSVVCPPLPVASLIPLESRNLRPTLFGLGIAILFSLLFGRTWSFVNRSSYQSLYAARLTRAYVGAGNPERTARRQPVTDPLPTDDVALKDFADPQVQLRGGPLHLINVTINETASANENTVNRDRKGIGMSVGPCGFSAGVSHHALLQEQASRLWPLHRAATPDEATKKLPRFNMFGLAVGDQPVPPREIEALSLANWTAISGAAVAPGLGFHNAAGLSFLIAFANIRLGYWWRSGSNAHEMRAPAFGIAPRLRGLLPVHYYLGLEFLGRFWGADDPHWYLSDGGHFENLGLYELIRRRLPVIVGVDAEADAKGGFESLVGLIGKARIDFGTEIEFLDQSEVADLQLPSGLLGPLEDLITTTEGEAPAPAKARMALARLRYPDGEPGWLLYVKAAYVDDEPLDLRAYRRLQPGFPHQTTGDQFFDETQWECYRKLGEHSAERLFGEGAPFHDFIVPPPPPPAVNADNGGSSNSADSPGAAP